MFRINPKHWIFLACLSFMAGFVDAVGFIELGGYFVSFMSGNSTRLGVGIAGGAGLLLPGGIILLFVAGVALGTAVGRYMRARRALAILCVITALLVGAALAQLFGCTWLAIGCMVLAMGAENTVFASEEEVHVGVTYMTGTLVKLGQRLVALLWGGPRWAWVGYALLWSSLVTGVAGGALSYHAAGLSCLWIPAFMALGLTIAAGYTFPKDNA